MPTEKEEKASRAFAEIAPFIDLESECSTKNGKVNIQFYFLFYNYI